jgi:predicted O-methyltransferase YrrM
MTGEPKPYLYRDDYVSERVPVWTAQFGALAGTPGLRMLEIGSFEGRSAVWFLENVLTADDATLVCVDPFYAETEERFDHNIEVTGVASKVTKIKRRSDDYLASRPADAFDLIYIDGDHHASSVLFDGMLAFPLLKPGGLLLFDDYYWLADQLPPHERPQIAIDVFLEALSGKYDVVHRDYQVLIRKR